MSIPFRFVAVCVWNVVVFFFGHRRIPIFCLEFVFNRKKKTNQPIFREQITSPGKLSFTGLSNVPWLAAGSKSGDATPIRKQSERPLELSRRQNIHNKTRVSSRKIGWLVWFSRLKMSYWRKLGTFWYFFSNNSAFLLPWLRWTRSERFPNLVVNHHFKRQPELSEYATF